MKKKLAFLLAATLLLGVAGCGAKEEPAVKEETPAAVEAPEAEEEESGGADLSGDPIKIGFTTVLTGDRSLEGEYGSNAAALVEEEINAASECLPEAGGG